MYNVKHPKIVRAYVVSYDQDTNIMYYEIKETYDSEEELARYLARFHKPVYNIWGNIIPNVYTNIYMDFQALNGITYSEFPFYSETNFNRLKFSHNKYICRHIFFYDSKDKPYYDVRKLRKKVEQLKKDEDISYWPYEYKNSKKRGEKPKHHICYTYRKNMQYIQRIKAADSMDVDPDYKEFVKPKDKELKCSWSDDFAGRRSSGWKDNPGVKSRHQWERKAKREFEKIKKKKS